MASSLIIENACSSVSGGIYWGGWDSII